MAERLRAANSPLVDHVVFRPGSGIDPPEVNVWLAQGVTDEAAGQLWCDVVVPAGGTRQGDTAVVMYDITGTTTLGDNADCP